MAACVAQPEFEEIGLSYSVTENYYYTYCLCNKTTSQSLGGY